MTFAEWLERAEYDSQKALCLTVGTDGLKHGVNKVMSVGLSGMFSKKKSAERETRVLYVEGARSEEVEQYTGVSKEYYAEQCRDKEAVVRIVREAVDASDFLVTYTAARFTIPWLAEIFLAIVEYECMDIINHVRLFDTGKGYPGDVVDIEALELLMLNELKGVKIKGYGFEDVFGRFCAVPSFGDMPTLEQKIHKLELLYQRMLVLDV